MVVTSGLEMFAISKADLEHECEILSCYFKVYVDVVTVKSPTSELVDYHKEQASNQLKFSLFLRTTCRIFTGKTYKRGTFTVAANIQ